MKYRKIEKCKECGSVLVMRSYGSSRRVECIVFGCWTGPLRDTEEEAEEAWNKIMGESDESVELSSDKMRTPIALAADKSGVIVVCNDGTAFVIEERGIWRQVSSIPGTKADK